MPTIATRAAEAMLRALGGTTIVLRVPAGAATAPANPGLGLNPPVTDDITIAPAILRGVARVSDPGHTTSPSALEAVFAASALAPHLERSGQSAEDFLASAYGVVQPRAGAHLEGGAQQPDARLLRITGMTIERFAGQEYLVTLALTE